MTEELKVVKRIKTKGFEAAAGRAELTLTIRGDTDKNAVLALQRWLRKMGYEYEMYFRG